MRHLLAHQAGLARPSGATAARGAPRLGADRRAARGGAAALGPGHEARRDRRLLRPSRRRGRATRRRPVARPVPRRGGRERPGGSTSTSASAQRSRRAQRGSSTRAAPGGSHPRGPAAVGRGCARQPARDARRRSGQLAGVPRRGDAGRERPRDGARDRPLLRRPRSRRRARRRQAPFDPRRWTTRCGRGPPAGTSCSRTRLVWSLGFRVDGDDGGFGLGGIGGFSGFGLRRPGWRWVTATSRASSPAKRRTQPRARTR